MSTDDNGSSRRLTLEDPISRGTLDQFKQIHEARTKIALSLLQLEQNKINLLGAAKRLDEQQRRLFEAALVERGVDPGTAIDIDANTGLMHRRDAEMQQPELTPVPDQPQATEPAPEAPPEATS